MSSGWQKRQHEDMFNKTDALFTVLQSKLMDTGFWCELIYDTIGVVEHQTGLWQFLWPSDSVQTQQPGRHERKYVVYNILDNITVQQKAMCDRFGDLAFLGLDNCTKLNEISQHFDDTKLPGRPKYARSFGFVTVKADLIRLHSSQATRNECRDLMQTCS